MNIAVQNRRYMCSYTFKDTKYKKKEEGGEGVEAGGAEWMRIEMQ